jgi:chromosome partitioning protein
MLGKIVAIKNHKGGVGKSFLTAQLGTGLALVQNRKVLILTSDTQNNILDYLCQGDRSFRLGLKAEVNHKGSGELFKLRDNLFFIPLEADTFSSKFPDNLKAYIESLRDDYDYILIDCAPMLKIDKVFLDVADKVIIPAEATDVNRTAVISLVSEIGDASKILALIVNKYLPKATQKRNLAELKAILGDKLPMPEPIYHLSQIEQLLSRSKSVWEYRGDVRKAGNIQMQNVLKSLLEIMQAMEMYVRPATVVV